VPAKARYVSADAKVVVMPAQIILWVDLRTDRSEPDLCSGLPPVYKTERVLRLPHLLQAVQSRQPFAVCIECDTPDARSFAALLEVRMRHATLPIIMLTEQRFTHLENAAFREWASFLVKPVSVRRLCDSLTSIERARRAVSTLAPAISYVSQNYPEKLSLAMAANLCELSRFQFSRSFKKEQGLTFRDFVVRIRIERAAELMRQSPHLSVTEAAFVVGFNDVSHFSRMFRRRLGVLPSRYRRTEGEPTQLPLFAAQKAGA
jgi:AraC-like DNA-binding protein